jgi:carboxylesterase type B
MFLAKWVDTWEDFTRFLANAFPGDEFTGIRQRIELQYPAKLFDFKQNQRMRAVLRDSTFVCNVRQIYNAFHNDSKVYTASFTIPPAQHGFDMYAIIWQAGVPVSDLMKQATPKVHDKLLTYYDTMWHAFAPVYQSRYVTHALTGDPNKNHHPYEPEWEPTVDNGNELTNSMKIGLFPFFEVGSDSQSSTANCAFWDEIATDVSLLLGHGSPPLVSWRTQLELR